MEGTPGRDGDGWNGQHPATMPVAVDRFHFTSGVSSSFFLIFFFFFDYISNTCLLSKITNNMEMQWKMKGPCPDPILQRKALFAAWSGACQWIQCILGWRGLYYMLLCDLFCHLHIYLGHLSIRRHVTRIHVFKRAAKCASLRRGSLPMDIEVASNYSLLFIMQKEQLVRHFERSSFHK